MILAPSKKAPATVQNSVIAAIFVSAIMTTYRRGRPHQGEFQTLSCGQQRACGCTTGCAIHEEVFRNGNTRSEDGLLLVTAHPSICFS
jgi:hypothetical protein